MKPLHRNENLVIQKADTETIVYDLLTNRAVCLNESSSIVWEECDGTRSISDLVEVLSLRLKSSVTEEFVHLALDQLSSEDLLENNPEGDFFSGMTRREVIRKVGLGTMAALPIVVAITVPLAVQAQSACVPLLSGCVCNMVAPNPGAIGMECQTNTTGTPCANAACVCLYTDSVIGIGDCAAP